jgi:hypothetical protein
MEIRIKVDECKLNGLPVKKMSEVEVPLGFLENKSITELFFVGIIIICYLPPK